MHRRCFVMSILAAWLVMTVFVSVGFLFYSPHTNAESTLPIIKQVQVTPAIKIISSVDKYAWPDGTDSEKWSYKTGGFKDDSVRAIYAELGYDELDQDSDCTPCNHFVDVIVYDALGIKIHIMPEDAYDDWDDLPDNFKIVHEGPIDDFGLMPGDIVRYKKNKKGGYRSQHSFIYYGDGLIAEAGIRTRYPVIYSEYHGSETIKWERDEVDQDTIQVIRIR